GPRDAGPEIRKLVGEHDHGIADHDLCVADSSVRIGVTHQLGRAERLLVKVEGGRAIADDQIRRDGRMPFWDGSHALAHLASPYRIRGGAPAVAPPPGPPTSLRDRTALLLTGSGGERRLSLLPRAPPPACGIAPRFSSLCGMLPRPGRLTRQKGGARCEDSCGSSVWFSPSR